MSSIGKRIEEALDLAEMSVKDLEDALEERGVAGGSYANLHRLKSDKKERPSAELLHGIARATDVSLAWLVAGEGEPTEERSRAAQAQQETRSDGSPDPSTEAIVKALQEVDLFEGPKSLGLRGMANEVLGAVITSRGQQLPDPDLNETEARLVVYALRSIVRGPWGLLRDGTEARWSDYRAYAIAMLHAVLIALPDAGKVDPRTLAGRLVAIGRGAGGYWRPFGVEELPDHVPEEEREEVARWLNESIQPEEE